VIARDAAWALLTEFTKSGSLRKHAFAVEASMRAYAALHAADPLTWGIAGMLHDFDYEIHPTAPHHPTKGAEILSARGVPARSSTPSSPTPTIRAFPGGPSSIARSTPATSCPAS
jgi:predicted hydrolase (HD superfamily)